MEFVVGGSNKGFTTVRDLKVFPTASNLYAGSVETSRVPVYGDYFEFDTLSQDHIRVGDKEMSHEEFYARNTCG